jgi:U3 small nucleolar RNA-associated protein 18
MATTTEDWRRRSIDSDKDSTEEELERLIFGDRAGFRDNLRNFKDVSEVKSKDVVLADASDDDEEGRTGLEGLADKDLFFLDDTPGDAPAIPLGAEDDDSDSGRDGAAWSDSDDERITVSLTSRTQLRKLRKTADDDVITGKEYSRRLRKQFQLLNQVPEWVKNVNKPVRKKRRTSSGSEVTDSSADEMDIDEEGSLSAQPLVRLLQDVDALTRTMSSKDGVKKKRRLREGTIDIQRMKDIAASGPVSSS